MPLYEFLLLFLSVAVGGLLAWKLRGIHEQYVKLFMSFVGAFVLSISLLHLMPALFKLDSSPRFGIWIMTGFFIQLLLEQFSKGVEHGHVHLEHFNSGRLMTYLFVGLCFHAFIEGLPLDGYEAVHHHHSEGQSGHLHLLYGIVLHKVPAAFALALVFLGKYQKPYKLIVGLFIFGAMTPLGLVVGSFLSGSIGADFINCTLALVVGSFLHIATTILFEVDGNNKHSRSIEKIIVILLGILIAVFAT